MQLIKSFRIYFLFLLLTSFLVKTSDCQSDFSYKYKSKEGGYTINFGKKPSITSQEVPTEAGNISMTMASYEKSFNEAYMVSHNDYPALIVESVDPYILLNGAVDGATTSQGMVIEQSRTEGDFQGYPSIYFKGNSTEGMEAIYRVVLKGNRMYQVIALKGDGEISERDENSFFGSFVINKDKNRKKETAQKSAIQFNKKYVSRGGKYTINFEGAPEITKEIVPSEVGDISITMVMYERSLTELFMISHNEYPKELVKASDPYVLLHGAVDGATGSQGITIEKVRREEKFDENPCVYFRGSSPEGMEVIYLVVIKGNIMYQLIAINSEAEVSKADEEAFFGSFKLR